MYIQTILYKNEVFFFFAKFKQILKSLSLLLKASTSKWASQSTRGVFVYACPTKENAFNT